MLERNNHPSRDANFRQPALTKAAAARMALDTSFDGTYTGAVLGSPLYVEDGAWGAARFVVVTSGNDVYAIDGGTGATVWTVNLGAPAAKSGVTGCDGSNPLGVISTPVIDPNSGTLYVAGAVGDAYGITAHQVWAVALADGAIKSGYPIDVSTTLGFEPKAHNQRGALSLVGGILYVPYGGHSGDCAGFQGRIVTVNTAASPPAVGGWVAAGSGEGIWASAGMASAGDGVFAVTGNRLGSTSSSHTDSEEVAHVRGAGTLDRSTGSKDVFFASDWKTKDQRDFDLGAVNPILVSLPGSTGPAAVIASKDGNAFILDTADLGKGPLVSFDVTMQGMNIRAVPTAYVAGSTTFYTIPIEGAWTGCPAATSNRSAIMAFAIAPSLPLKPSVAWCASYSMVPKGGDEGVRYGGPAAPGLISTTTDGSSDALVWYMDGGNQLVALDGATGALVFKARRRMWQRAQVDLGDRDQGPDRRRRRRQALLLVSALRQRIVRSPGSRDHVGAGVVAGLNLGGRQRDRVDTKFEEAAREPVVRRKLRAPEPVVDVVHVTQRIVLHENGRADDCSVDEERHPVGARINHHTDVGVDVDRQRPRVHDGLQRHGLRVVGNLKRNPCRKSWSRSGGRFAASGRGS